MEFGLARWMLPSALGGALLGAWLAARTSPGSLRQLYGWYLIVLGAANWINFHPRVPDER